MSVFICFFIQWLAEGLCLPDQNGRIVTASTTTSPTCSDGETVSAIGKNLPMKERTTTRPTAWSCRDRSARAHGIRRSAGRFSDDFKTGTIAAAFGGTTTIIDFAIPSRASDAQARAWLAKSEGKCHRLRWHMAITKFENQDKAEMKRL
jgi:dihydropyrimidinase